MTETRHARTLVLGAGFGGIAVATRLREALGRAADVVLIDRSPEFAMGLRKLWHFVGIDTLAAGSRARRALSGDGIEFVQTEIRRIDPTSRSVETDAGAFSGDRLVVALGAAQRPDLVPGLAEHGYDLWSEANVPAAASALAEFSGGRILVLVAGAPYPCPPAPYECAFLLDEHLEARGLRETCDILVATVQPMLMPNAGKDGSAWMAARLDERAIGHRAKIALEEVTTGTVRLEDDEIPFDLLLAVPPHRPPAVLAGSGLIGDSGWIDVDPGTLEAGLPGVYALGDSTMIRLANGLPMPKAGLVAELEGLRVAEAIVASEMGDSDPPAFDGVGECFIETGSGTAAVLRGRFFEEPAPTIEIQPQSAANAAEKRRFEADRLARWFPSPS